MLDPVATIREIKKLDLSKLTQEQKDKAIAKLIAIRDLDPFWSFVPNDGVLTEQRRAILRRYLKEDDIPQRVDSQLDVILCTSNIVGDSGGNRADKTTTGCIKGLIKTTGEIPDSLKPYQNILQSYIDRAHRKFIKGRVTGVNSKQLHTRVMSVWKYWVPREYLKNGVWEDSYSKEFDILTLYRKGKPCATIEFMTNEQEVKSTQGGELDWALFDEEPDMDKYKETLMRFATADRLDIEIDWTPTEGLCFDEETEILTEYGWRRWDEVSLGEKIITYNMKYNHLEWDDIIGIYRNSDYKGKMYYLYNKNFDAFVTPEHRWVVNNHKTKKIEIVATEKLRTHHSIKRIAKFEDSPLNTLEMGLGFCATYPDEFVELCGWIIGDGTFPKGKRYIKIYQSQTRYPEKCRRIRYLLDTLNCDWYEKNYPYSDNKAKYRLVTHFYIKRGWADRFREVIPGKEISPKFLTQLTQVQLKLLYKGLMQSDGHYVKNKNSHRFGQKKIETMDGFQMLCVLLGRQANYTIQKDKIVASMKTENIKQSDTWIQSLKKKIIDFSGLIWCVQTKNTTLIARRNGKFYITGNTWATNLFHEGIFEGEEIKQEIALFKQTPVCNRYVNPKTLMNIMDEYAKVSSYEEMKMRLLGEAISLSGLVYGSIFDQKIHVIDPFEITYKDFVVYRGLDPHLVKPTVAVEVAMDREGFEYVIGTYSKQADTEIIKADLRQRAIDRKYRLGWTRCDKSADSEIKILGGRNIFLELARGKDAIPALFVSEKFTGSINAGVDEIKKRLKVDPVINSPNLFIFNTPENKELIKSFRTLERDTYANEDKKGMKDRINEGKHDAHAALRYAHQYPMRWMPVSEERPEPVREESFV